MFLLIFRQLVKMFLIMAVAFFCYRRGLVDQQGNRSISNILLMIVNPVLIVTVYQTDYDPTLVRGLLLSFAAAAAAHFIAIGVATIFTPAKNNPEYYLDRFGAIYSNCGFIGIPLINSVLGSKGVFFLSAYMTVFNIFSWTHGLGLLHGKFSLKYLKKGLLSPMVIGALLGITLFFLKLRIPGVLADSMDYIANMNTPLAMMVAGFSVAQSDLKRIFTNVRIYRCSLLKLVIVPLCVCIFLRLAHIEHDVAYTTLIASACPTATTLTMMSIRYNKNYTYASELFAFTTVCSILTIPFVTFLAGLILS